MATRFVQSSLVCLAADYDSYENGGPFSRSNIPEIQYDLYLGSSRCHKNEVIMQILHIKIL